MEKILNILFANPLFKKMTEDEVLASLNFFNYSIEKFEKNNLIFIQGEAVTKIGIVLEGEVIITKNDFWGNRLILNKLGKGNIFGEVLAFSNVLSSSINVESINECSILFLDISDFYKDENANSSKYSKFIYNLFQILLKKNLFLREKLEHVTQKTLRDKIISYLSSKAVEENSNSFKLNLNRQELADYLGVDRAALSRELSNLKKEGILNYDKNNFILYK